MPIEVTCDSCQRRLRVPDKVAGKRIKCPKCEGILAVPAAGASQVVAAASPIPSGTSSKQNAGRWHLQLPDGSQYGPVPRRELDQWYTEGRITSECQVLREGAPQWQWASDLYPELDDSADAAANDPAEADMQVAENPFAALAAVEKPGSGAISVGSGIASGAPAAGEASSSDNPYEFFGAETSPSARLRGGRKTTARSKKGRRNKGGGGAVTAVAVVNYIFGGLGVLGGLLLAIGGATLATMIGGAFAEAPDPDAQQAGAFIGGVATAVFVGIGIVFILASSVMVAAGFGVQQRANWGRILTLVLGGLHGALALFSLVTLNPGGLLNLGYAIFVFVVLLDKKNAAEFA